MHIYADYSFFLADKEEVDLEEQEECLRQGKQLRGRGHLLHALPKTLQKYTQVFCYRFYQMFHRLPSLVSWLVLNLQDNPKARLNWSAGSVPHRIPCVRKDSLFLYVPYISRWLSFRERLALHGWPTYRELSDFAGVEFYDVMHKRTREHKRMLGDSMHTANIAVASAVALACCEPV